MLRKYKILYGLEAADAGTLKHLTYLVTSISAELFDVTVILSTQRSTRVYADIEKMTAAGAKILVMPMKRKIVAWQDLKCFLTIWTHLRHHTYDIVHAHSSKAGILFRLAAWLNQVPLIIYTPHCFYFQSKKGIKKVFFASVERIMALITSYIIVANNEKRSALEQNVAPAAKLVNINNAINFNEYPQADPGNKLTRRLKITSDQMVVAAIGRLSVQKNWPMYIKTAAEVIREFEDVIFLIVGDGELQDELMAVIKNLEMESRIFFTGHYTHIAEVYALADIIVSTSLWEGLPYVLLEAMWYKKPLVATNLNYRNILFEAENAFLVEPGNDKLLAAQIKRLLLDKPKRRAMGELGHQLLKANFSFDFFIKKHEEVYTQYADILCKQVPCL
ncbi:glycosyltransferase involved in cell wall biosynthesis [Pedobacter sp. AK017]|uniref:glycosyltransferase n=1 Tax=Pedobacter sp. AK017 TaxID=2723073 RepID=UPI001609987A|nr:glycosyltransferase [Pedobacter sp. AK017]MBB5441235.1 glycosyltransferase involved in cell wall biosynthesis [Pedobacter sp. AK017]